MLGHLKPEKFIALFDGEALSERDSRHLENCGHCQSRRKALESVYKNVSSIDGDVPEPDWEHFRGFVRTELLSRSVRRQTASAVWGLRPSMGWALSIVMAVVVTAAVFTFPVLTY